MTAIKLAKVRKMSTMQQVMHSLEDLFNDTEMEEEDSIEEEYLKSGEVKMKETEVKREKTRSKDLSLRRLSKLKADELSLLVIDELELIGIRMPAKPKRPRKPGSDEKYNTAINAIRKLSKELDKPESSNGYGWRYGITRADPTQSQVTSYKREIGKLIEELVTDKVKIDADYKKRMEQLGPKLAEHKNLIGIYKEEKKDYDEVKVIYDKTKHALVKKIEISKTQVK